MSANTPRKFTIWLSIIASQATLLFTFGYGSCIILISTTITMDEDLKLTEKELTHFNVNAKWTLIIACGLFGYLADFIGRRRTLIIFGGLSCLGFIMMATSQSYALLIAGRVISLFSLGLGLPITILYVGEVASPRHRGFLNTIPEVFSTFGLWLAVMMRAVVSDFSETLQWRLLLGVGVLPSLVLGVGMVFMPESPSWSIMQGRVAETKATLQMTLKTTREVDERLSALRSAARVPPTTSNDVEVVEVPPSIHILAIWKEVIQPRSLSTTLVKAITSILILHFLQQATGIDLLTSEAMVKFKFHLPFMSLEFFMNEAPFLCGRLFNLCAPLLFSDTLERRTLINLSWIFTAMSMMAMNLSSFAHREDVQMHKMASERMTKWSLVAFFASFSIGLGPLTWVHTSEVLPFKVRAQVIGIVVMLNKLMSFGLSCLKPLINPNVSVVMVFLDWILFVLFAIAIVLFVKFFIETKGQSLEELDELPRGSTIELN